MSRSPVSFPDGFLWGAATASYQIEGAVAEDGRGPSVWDAFSHTPGKVAGGDTGDIACDHYHRLGDDIALMAELGIDAYRFSISWSRVMPDGRGRVNPAGVSFYQELVDRLLEAGIAPVPTLFHWDLPLELEQIGGFRHRDLPKWFADYAALMVGELGDRVTQWATFNEPWCYAYLGHASGRHAPGLTDDRAAIAVAHHQLLAHGLAVQAMRAERDGMACGIVINPSPVRNTGGIDEDQIDRVDALLNRWWFDALLKGSYPDGLIDDLGPLAEAVQPGDDAVIAQPLDWVGVNYYFDQVLRPADDDHPEMTEFPTVTGVAHADPPAVHTDMGWPITPDGFTELLLRLRDDYPNLPPVYITENGAAYHDPVIDGRVADTRRIDYTDLHLRAVHDAIADGVDVRGYFHWSLMDNFEWAEGYGKRFGLIHIDYDTLERTTRDSFAWYHDVIARNGLLARGNPD